MSTPCQQEPEAWVGDSADLRAEAATLCRTACPVYAECLAGKFGTPGPDDSGVWAGVDYLNGRPSRLVLKPCEGCGKPVTRNRAKYCSPKCYHASQVKSCGPTEKTCGHCGTTFQRTYHSMKQWTDARFCSSSCSARGYTRKTEVAA